MSNDGSNSWTPVLPPGLRLYVIGDIHGEWDALNKILDLIERDRNSRPISHSIEVYLGDYIDRGGDSSRVLSSLVARIRGRPTVYLMGNHESYLLESMRNPAAIKHWMRMGGNTTVASYGIEPPDRIDTNNASKLQHELLKAMPSDHLEFMARAPTSFVCGDYLFVHAGVRPNVAVGHQSQHDLTTIREPFLSYRGSFGCMVVHGHTVVSEPEFHPNRININTLYSSDHFLTCLVLEGTTKQLLISKDLP